MPQFFARLYDRLHATALLHNPTYRLEYVTGMVMTRHFLQGHVMFTRYEIHLHCATSRVLWLAFCPISWTYFIPNFTCASYRLSFLPIFNPLTPLSCVMYICVDSWFLLFHFLSRLTSLWLLGRPRLPVISSIMWISQVSYHYFLVSFF